MESPQRCPCSGKKYLPVLKKNVFTRNGILLSGETSQILSIIGDGTYSVEISDDQVDSELQRRLLYFENQLGSIEKVEEYFSKTKIEI